VREEAFVFEFKIEGLDHLDKSLKELSQAFGSLEGEIGHVRFNPDDPHDVERAINEAQGMVNVRLSCFRHNPWASQIGDALKEKIREGISEKARQAR
jgi:hypothetical protein